jgi:5-methyltetrahydrofolate--homocysteine methyltransferase
MALVPETMTHTLDITFSEACARIDTRMLFRSYWRGAALKGKNYEDTCINEFEPALQRLYTCIRDEDLWGGRVMYHYCDAQADADTVTLVPDGMCADQGIRLVFPTSKKLGQSVAQFITPAHQRLAIQAVTIGEGLARKSNALFAENRYSDGFYLHALGTYMTEVLADYVTDTIREHMKIKGGRRYSFGYPGMPKIEEQRALFDALPITGTTGIILNEAAQMVPEHSTVGLFIINPRATYLY